MRILGIDPGLRTTGFGVIDVEGSKLSYVASGTVSTQHLDTRALPARLKVIFDGVSEVVQRYQPDCAVVEIVFVSPPCCWGRPGAPASPPWCRATWRWPNTPPCR